MRKGVTLIEVLVVLAIIAIIAVGIFSFAGSGFGGATTPYGRNLRLISTEYGGINTYHYEDVNTGEKFYSHQEGGVLYPE